MAVFVTIILLVFSINKLHSENVCETPTCIIEAAKILQQIDSSVDPCEDFYNFACGNLIKSSYGEKMVFSYDQIREKEKHDLGDMYAEGINRDDHRIVNAAKILYQKCMDQEEIREDELVTIKDAIKFAGGWPVLEGINWKEENFNWIQATYKLRELGFPSSMFLNIGVRTNAPPNKYSLTVEGGSCTDGILERLSNEEAVNIMTEIAVIFGSDRSTAAEEMTEVYQFWKTLRSNGSSCIHTNGHYFYYNVTLSKLQENHKRATFSWLEFINNVTSPAPAITESTIVWTREYHNLPELINILSTTSKRTVANYMIWKVIEELIPYLPHNVQDKANYKSENVYRKEFCQKEVEKRFLLSPIEIMYNRKYLPASRRKQLEELLQGLKHAFVDFLKTMDWMEEEDKKKTLEKAEATVFVIGLPGNYFDDKLLEVLDADLATTTRTNSFLSALGQANRNYQTSLYNQINMFVSENLIGPNYRDDYTAYIKYVDRSKVLYVPAAATDGFAFKEDRPNYLNYKFGIFTAILQYFGIWQFGRSAERWSEQTRNTLDQREQCLLRDIRNCGRDDDGKHRAERHSVRYQGIEDEVAYTAYQKWVQMNGEEQSLIGLNYTASQLFWISSIKCYKRNSHTPLKYSWIKSDMSYITCGATRNNKQFGKDFNCPTGSKLNPPTKCNFF